MRRILVISLLLVLLSAASGAIPAMCAGQCAGTPAHAHAAPARKAHGHHHPAAAGPQSSAGATGAPHCVKSAQPAVAEEALPRVHLAGVAPAAIADVTAPVATCQLPLERSAAPPGAPLLNAPLRI